MLYTEHLYFSESEVFLVTLTVPSVRIPELKISTLAKKASHKQYKYSLPVFEQMWIYRVLNTDQRILH